MYAYLYLKNKDEYILAVSVISYFSVYYALSSSIVYMYRPTL